MQQSSAAYDLTLEAIVQRYGGVGAAPAVDGVTLQIHAGELVALLGPSGCGKTTLLRIIAGFVEQTEGRVVVGGRSIDDLPPNMREVGVVFQNYALFPHMTAAQNVAYGLACRGESRSRQEARAREMLDLVQMSHLAERLPRELSGGQQQRVALARALAVNPRILLLDEPFAALDKSLRLDMQIEVKRLQRLSGITCIMVTHDQEEALSMADRVAVINKGRLEQFAHPNTVYDEPASLFVNQFVGTANSLAGRVASTDGQVVIADSAVPARLVSPNLKPGDPVTVCVRPEHLSLAASGPGLSGQLALSLPQGAHIIQEVRLDSGEAIKVVQSRGDSTTAWTPGSRVVVRLRPGTLSNAFSV